MFWLCGLFYSKQISTIMEVVLKQIGAKLTRKTTINIKWNIRKHIKQFHKLINSSGEEFFGHKMIFTDTVCGIFHERIGWRIIYSFLAKLVRRCHFSSQVNGRKMDMGSRYSISQLTPLLILILLDPYQYTPTHTWLMCSLF